MKAEELRGGERLGGATMWEVIRMSTVWCTERKRRKVAVNHKPHGESSRRDKCVYIGTVLKPMSLLRPNHSIQLPMGSLVCPSKCRSTYKEKEYIFFHTTYMCNFYQSVIR